MFTSNSSVLHVTKALELNRFPAFLDHPIIISWLKSVESSNINLNEGETLIIWFHFLNKWNI